MARLPDSVKAFSFQALLCSEAELHQVRAALVYGIKCMIKKKRKRKKRATVDLRMLTWTCPLWRSHLVFLKQSYLEESVASLSVSHLDLTDDLGKEWLEMC